MFQVEFDKELFQKMIDEAVDNALKRHAIKRKIATIIN